MAGYLQRTNQGHPRQKNLAISQSVQVDKTNRQSASEARKQWRKRLKNHEETDSSSPEYMQPRYAPASWIHFVPFRFLFSELSKLKFQFWSGFVSYELIAFPEAWSFL